jgi:hypothetical protein
MTDDMTGLSTEGQWRAFGRTALPGYETLL